MAVHRAHVLHLQSAIDEHEHCCRDAADSRQWQRSADMISIDGKQRLESIKLHANSFLSEFMNSKSRIEIVCQAQETELFHTPICIHLAISIENNCFNLHTKTRQQRRLLADAKHHESHRTLPNARARVERRQCTDDNLSGWFSFLRSLARSVDLDVCIAIAIRTI